MQQLDELDSIFGRKALSQPEAAEEQPRLQIFITHSHTPMFRLISIGRDNALAVLPLLLKHVAAAIHEYVAGGPPHD